MTAEDVIHFLKHKGIRLEIANKDPRVPATEAMGLPFEVLEAAGAEQGKLKKFVRQGKLKSSLYKVKGRGGAVLIYYTDAFDLPPIEKADPA